MKRPSVAEALGALPEPTRDLVRAVLDAADVRDVGVYLVGGPVRDLLLGRPVADADLLVESPEVGDAEALARAAAPEAARVTVHARFGTATLTSGEASVDLATARSESYAHDGALPTVGPGSLEDDLARRDFSVNALALPLSGPARGRRRGVVAPPEALTDLAERRLRVLHDRSFHDDPTRALRAARLAPRLDFSLTRGSRNALRGALRDGAFGRVSGERLRRELVKLFEDTRLGLDPSRALRLLHDWHVLGALEPGLALDPAASAPLRRLGRALEAPPWRRGRFRPWVPGFCLWLAPLAPGLRRRALARFAVRGDVAARVAGFPKARDGWLRQLDRVRGRGATDAILRQLDEEDLTALHACAAPPLRRRIARYAGEDRARRAPLTGDDLTAIGLSGPAVGRALARVRAAYLDGLVKSEEEALALARELSRGRGRAEARRRDAGPS